MPSYADTLASIGPNPKSPQGAPEPTGVGAMPVGNAARPIDDETATAAYWLKKMSSKYGPASAEIQGWITRLAALSSSAGAPPAPPNAGPPAMPMPPLGGGAPGPMPPPVPLPGPPGPMAGPPGVPLPGR